MWYILRKDVRTRKTLCRGVWELRLKRGIVLPGESSMLSLFSSDFTIAMAYGTLPGLGIIRAHS